jgi:hypothetical protein
MKQTLVHLRKLHIGFKTDLDKNYIVSNGAICRLPNPNFIKICSVLPNIKHTVRPTQILNIPLTLFKPFKKALQL